MRAHWAHLKQVVLHKWFVFWECCRLGVPIAGITHDVSKFSLVEWGAYVSYFYDRDGSRKPRRKGGTYDVGEAARRFQVAFLHHIRSNRHHWQAWVLMNDGSKLTAVEMSARYRKEMLADWRGAGHTHKESDGSLLGVAEWYKLNRDKLVLHPRTRAWVEANL